eukprot:30422-Pelagococcus_subviridis.AAC.3
MDLTPERRVAARRTPASSRPTARSPPATTTTGTNERTAGSDGRTASASARGGRTLASSPPLSGTCRCRPDAGKASRKRAGGKGVSAEVAARWGRRVRGVGGVGRMPKK